MDSYMRVCVQMARVKRALECVFGGDKGKRVNE